MLNFLRGFVQNSPQVLRAVQGFGAKAAPTVKAVADKVTNPQTYRALAGQAERVLQKPLPQAFSGTNFNNIPTHFTGMITDLTNAPAGLTRNVQTGMVNRAIQEAAGIAPQLARTASQTAEGALRAPVIGNALRAGQSVITNPLQTAIQTGGQFARDPNLRREFIRQFGGTSEKAARALSGQSGFGQVGSMLRNLAPGGVTGLQGTAVLGGMGSMAWGLADPTPMIEAGRGITGFLQDRGLAYDPRRDPRVTPIQDRPIVNPGELAPDYSGSLDRASRFSEYQALGGTPPPAPVLPPPPEVVDRRAGQQIPPAAPVAPGTLSNGAGVPAQRQNVQQRALSQEVLNAAQQYSAPAGISLPSFYAGQQQLGRSMEQTGELQRQLKEIGGATGMNNEALMQWAQANPELAYRELMRLKGRSQ
jgi:hypothetical protein